jgi:hypothetical protein
MFLRVYLANIPTGRFFQSPRQWVDSLAAATRFQSANDAINLAFEARLEETELLLVFELPQYREVHLPLAMPLG